MGSRDLRASGHAGFPSAFPPTGVTAAPPPVDGKAADAVRRVGIGSHMSFSGGVARGTRLDQHAFLVLREREHQAQQQGRHGQGGEEHENSF